MALRKSHLYASLWQSCDQLRGGMDASQYKDYVLTLLFMKYVSDKYSDDDYSDIRVPAGGGFPDIVALKGRKEIGDGINVVIRKLADANEYLLKGVLDQADFNDETRLGQGKEMTDRLTKLVAIFEGLDFRAHRTHGDDILGDAYEYLMRHFATQSGKSKGQFYTPAEVSRIMARVIGVGPDTRLSHSVYDPTCGSGSLLIKAVDAAPRGLTVYGQEMDVATWTMARMNMILHGNTTAEIERGNTLAVPGFTDGPTRLKRFDFAVANPPFSAKAWSNGVDPDNDPFRRFEYGIPPAKNGDCAFLLHFVASLKSTGRGAIILPHGVLFRGNREARIRRNLVERGWIKGIIGLPANLFYGTGIPACIVVIDKEQAATRKGIFMVDASKAFQKDGAKNRLRERDIHRIVDVFNDQRDTPGFARMAPLDEIASAENDFNLNIPRYVDSSETEDLQDLRAHLRGGVPDRDIDALDKYWHEFPTLRRALFAPGDRQGYGRVRVPADDVSKVVLGHDAFIAYRKRVQNAVADWRAKHEPRLYGLDVDDSPKALIRELSEDLLGHFANLPLIDAYDVYQCLMDYWDEVMQDDVYLVVTGGWAAGRELRTPHKKETPDFVTKSGGSTRKHVGTLIPADLVVTRFFGQENTELAEMDAALEAITEQKAAFEKENTSDDGALVDLEGKKGAITKGKVQQRAVALKAVILQSHPPGTPEHSQAKGIAKTTFGSRPWTCGTQDDEGLFEELDRLYEYLRLHAKELAQKRSCKQKRDELYTQVLIRYKTLTEADIKSLVVVDKWITSIEAAVSQRIDCVTTGLADRVMVLQERYGATLPELAQRVEGLEARLRVHLRDMGVG